MKKRGTRILAAFIFAILLFVTGCSSQDQVIILSDENTSSEFAEDPSENVPVTALAQKTADELELDLAGFGYDTLAIRGTPGEDSIVFYLKEPYATSRDGFYPALQYFLTVADDGKVYDSVLVDIGIDQEYNFDEHGDAMLGMYMVMYFDGVRYKVTGLYEEHDDLFGTDCPSYRYTFKEVGEGVTPIIPRHL